MKNYRAIHTLNQMVAPGVPFSNLILALDEAVDTDDPHLTSITNQVVKVAAMNLWRTYATGEGHPDTVKMLNRDERQPITPNQAQLYISDIESYAGPQRDLITVRNHSQARHLKALTNTIQLGLDGPTILQTSRSDPRYHPDVRATYIFFSIETPTVSQRNLLDTSLRNDPQLPGTIHFTHPIHTQTWTSPSPMVGFLEECITVQHQALMHYGDTEEMHQTAEERLVEALHNIGLKNTLLIRQPVSPLYLPRTQANGSTLTSQTSEPSSDFR